MLLRAQSSMIQQKSKWFRFLRQDLYLISGRKTPHFQIQKALFPLKADYRTLVIVVPPDLWLPYLFEQRPLRQILDLLILLLFLEQSLPMMVRVLIFSPASEN